MLNKTNGIKAVLKFKKNIWIIARKSFLSTKEFIKDLFEIKNNEGVNTTTVIWVVILVGIAFSFGTLKLTSVYVEKVNSKQISLVNTIYDKFGAFSTDNYQIKNIKQYFVWIIKSKKFNKTNEVLSKLLEEAQKMQPEIDELKLLSQQDKNFATGIKYKAIFNSYYKAANLQDRDNKKLIEMINLGLTMNWKNPTKEQTTKWKSLATELGSIENEIKDVQLEIQDNLYQK